MEETSKIALLQELIRIDTANGNEDSLAQYLKNLFEHHHIQAHIIAHAATPGRSNIVAEIGPKDSQNVLALAAHLDTVAVGNIDNWDRNPWSGDFENGIVYGRGAADMKSGLAAMVITMIELSERELTQRIRFIGTAGEELGAAGSKELTTQGLVHDVSAMVIGEPTGGDIVFAHSGSVDYTINSYGRGAHSSMPELGNNAITNLVKFIEAEKSAFDDAAESPVLGPLVHSVTVIKGGTQVNSIPEFASLQGNIRPVPEFDEHQTEQRLQSIVNRLNQDSVNQLELVVDFSFSPVVNDPEDPFIAAIQSAHIKAFGQPAKLKIIHGATDASEYIKDTNHFPMIVLGAGEWEDAHSLNESVSVDNYLKVLDTYKNLAIDWQTGKQA